MSTCRHFDRVCAAVTLAALLLTVLFMNGQALGIELVTDADSEAHSDSTYLTDNDLLADWDVSSATVITLEGDTVSINGNNAYEYNGNVVISNSGTFIVSGTLDDGTITVDANDNSKVWILFRDVTISCSDDACLRIDEADKVFLTLAEGSQNTLTGGTELSEEALEDGTYGVIFAHDDLTINGSGSLTIKAGYRHGIKANNDLVITGGSITIDAPADAIHVNDSFRLCGASLDLTAGDDGVLVENEDGYFYMESGSITADSEGDAIHANGGLTIAGGDLTIDAADDAVHADGAAVISGGMIRINSCYEGIEGATVDISGGEITICPTDDGINAGGGSGSLSGFNMTGPAGSDASSSEAEADSAAENSVEGSEEMNARSSGDCWIRISGGTITIINESGNDADGIDSNGSIYISGGTLMVSLTDSGMNNAIDVGSESGGIIVISGGTVIACGSSGMVESVDASSTQCSVMYSPSESMASGTALSLMSSDGEEILNWEVPCSFSCAVLSSPDLSQGGSYTITAGDTEESVTLEQTVTTLGEAGGMMSGGRMSGHMQNMTPPGAENSTEGSADSEQAAAFQGMTPPDGEDATERAAGGHPGGGMGGHRADENTQFMPGSENAVSETESEETVSTILSYDRPVYILLLASVIVLTAGLIIAVRYRK